MSHMGGQKRKCRRFQVISALPQRSSVRKEIRHGWDKKSAIQAQEATAAQQSRDQAISDDEIDLDAGDDPDEWSVYLTSIPQTK